MSESDDRQIKHEQFMQRMREKWKERRERPRPEALTAELLGATPDDKLSQVVMDYVTGQLKKVPPHDRGELIRKFPTAIRVVYAMIAVEAEVNNGGFHQFFFNSSGAYAGDALTGFELLGLNDYAELMRRATKCFADENEMQNRIRQNRNLETFSASYKETNLGGFDKEFYALNRSNPLRSVANRYIREHVQEFITN